MTHGTPSSTGDSHLRTADFTRSAAVPLVGLLRATSEPSGSLSQNRRGNTREGSSDGQPQQAKHATPVSPRVAPADSVEEGRYGACTRGRRGMRASQVPKRFLETTPRGEGEGENGKEDEVPLPPGMRAPQEAPESTRRKRPTKHLRSEGEEARRLSHETARNHLNHDCVVSPCSPELHTHRSSGVQPSSMHVSTRRQLDRSPTSSASNASPALTAACTTTGAQRRGQQSAALVGETSGVSDGSTSTADRIGNTNHLVPSSSTRERGVDPSGSLCPQDDRGDNRNVNGNLIVRSRCRLRTDEGPVPDESPGTMGNGPTDELQPKESPEQEPQGPARKAEESLDSLMQTMFQPLNSMLRMWGRGCVTAQLRDYNQRQRKESRVTHPAERSKVYEDGEAEGLTTESQLRGEKHETQGEGEEVPGVVESNANKGTADNSATPCLPQCRDGEAENSLFTGTKGEPTRSCPHTEEDGKKDMGEASLLVRQSSGKRANDKKHGVVGEAAEELREAGQGSEVVQESSERQPRGEERSEEGRTAPSKTARVPRHNKQLLEDVCPGAPRLSVAQLSYAYSVIWTLATADPRSCRVCYWFFCNLLHFFAQERLRHDPGLASVLREVLVDSNAASKIQDEVKHRKGKPVFAATQRASLPRNASPAMPSLPCERTKNSGDAEILTRRDGFPSESSLPETPLEQGEGARGTSHVVNPLLLGGNREEKRPTWSSQVATSFPCSQPSAPAVGTVDALSGHFTTTAQPACRQDPKETASVEHAQGRSSKRICLPSITESTLPANGGETGVAACDGEPLETSRYAAGSVFCAVEIGAGLTLKGAGRCPDTGHIFEEMEDHAYTRNGRDGKGESSAEKHEAAVSDRGRAGNTQQLDRLPAGTAREALSPPAGVQLVVQIVSIWRQYLHFAYNLSKIFAPVDGMQNSHLLVQKLQTTQLSAQQLHLWTTNLPFHQSAAAARDFALPFRPLYTNTAALPRRPSRHSDKPQSLSKGPLLHDVKDAAPYEGTETKLPSSAGSARAQPANDTHAVFTHYAESPGTELQTAGKTQVGTAQKGDVHDSQNTSEGGGGHGETLLSKVSNVLEHAGGLDQSERIRNSSLEQPSSSSSRRTYRSRHITSRVASKKDSSRTRLCTISSTCRPNHSGRDSPPTAESIAELVALSVFGEATPVGPQSKILKKPKVRGDGERSRGRRGLTCQNSEEYVDTEAENTNATDGVPRERLRKTDVETKLSISVTAAATVATAMQEAAVPLSVAALRIFQTVLGKAAETALRASVNFCLKELRAEALHSVVFEKVLTSSSSPSSRLPFPASLASSASASFPRTSRCQTFPPLATTAAASPPPPQSFSGLDRRIVREALVLLRRLHDSSQMKLVSTGALHLAGGKQRTNNLTEEKRKHTVPKSYRSRESELTQDGTGPVRERGNEGQDTDRSCPEFKRNEETSTASSQAGDMGDSSHQTGAHSRTGGEQNVGDGLTDAVSASTSSSSFLLRTKTKGAASRTNPWAGPQWVPVGGMGQHGTWGGSVKVTEKMTSNTLPSLGNSQETEFLKIANCEAVQTAAAAALTRFHVEEILRLPPGIHALLLQKDWQAIKPLFIILRRWPDDALSRFAEAFRTHWVNRFSAAFSLSSVSTSFSHPCLHSSNPSLDFSSGLPSSSPSSFAHIVEGLSALVRELSETELELKKEFSYHPSLKKARDEAFEEVLNGPNSEKILVTCARPLADRFSSHAADVSSSPASSRSSSSSSGLSCSTPFIKSNLRSDACEQAAPPQIIRLDSATYWPFSVSSISPFSPFFLFSHLFFSSPAGQSPPASSSSSRLSSSALLSAAVADYVDQYLKAMVELSSAKFLERSPHGCQITGACTPYFKTQKERRHEYDCNMHEKGLCEGELEHESSAAFRAASRRQSSIGQDDCELEAAKISPSRVEYRHGPTAQGNRDDGAPSRGSRHRSFLQEKHWLESICQVVQHLQHRELFCTFFKLKLARRMLTRTLGQEDDSTFAKFPWEEEVFFTARESGRGHRPKSRQRSSSVHGQTETEGPPTPHVTLTVAQQGNTAGSRNTPRGEEAKMHQLDKDRGKERDFAVGKDLAPERDIRGESQEQKEIESSSAVETKKHTPPRGEEPKCIELQPTRKELADTRCILQTKQRHAGSEGEERVLNTTLREERKVSSDQTMKERGESAAMVDTSEDEEKQTRTKGGICDEQSRKGNGVLDGEKENQGLEEADARTQKTTTADELRETVKWQNRRPRRVDMGRMLRREKQIAEVILDAAAGDVGKQNEGWRLRQIFGDLEASRRIAEEFSLSFMRDQEFRRREDCVGATKSEESKAKDELQKQGGHQGIKEEGTENGSACRRRRDAEERRDLSYRPTEPWEETSPRDCMYGVSLSAHKEDSGSEGVGHVRGLDTGHASCYSSSSISVSSSFLFQPLVLTHHAWACALPAADLNTGSSSLFPSSPLSVSPSSSSPSVPSSSNLASSLAPSSPRSSSGCRLPTAKTEAKVEAHDCTPASDPVPPKSHEPGESPILRSEPRGGSSNCSHQGTVAMEKACPGQERRVPPEEGREHKDRSRRDTVVVGGVCLPRCLAVPLQAFSRFYTERFPERRLTWQLRLSRMHLRCSFSTTASFFFHSSQSSSAPVVSSSSFSSLPASSLRLEACRGCCTSPGGTVVSHREPAACVLTGGEGPQRHQGSQNAGLEQAVCMPDVSSVPGRGSASPGVQAFEEGGEETAFLVDVPANMGLILLLLNRRPYISVKEAAAETGLSLYETKKIFLSLLCPHQRVLIFTDSKENELKNAEESRICKAFCAAPEKACAGQGSVSKDRYPNQTDRKGCVRSPAGFYASHDFSFEKCWERLGETQQEQQAFVCLHKDFAPKETQGGPIELEIIEDAALTALIPTLAIAASAGVLSSPSQVSCRGVDGVNPPKAAIRNPGASSASKKKQDSSRSEPAVTNTFFESHGLVEAAIVRTMKRHKRLKHCDLLQKVQMYIQLRTKDGRAHGEPAQMKDKKTSGSAHAQQGLALRPFSAATGEKQQEKKKRSVEVDTGSKSQIPERNGFLLSSGQGAESGPGAETAEILSRPETSELPKRAGQKQDTGNATEHVNAYRQHPSSTPDGDEKLQETEEELSKTGIPISVFKKRLESLIEREFIGRDESDTSIYVYIP
ncbi:cullin family protein [Cystoisospora suis]|uniref:Cullin family protein n=1 Tax=Cystoisospora suis TaxID=483139 RepID=A0A2C6L9R4_9APIC|nr:cullin family protein [Cystoisospora suis]